MSKQDVLNKIKSDSDENGSNVIVTTPIMRGLISKVVNTLYSEDEGKKDTDSLNEKADKSAVDNLIKWFVPSIPDYKKFETIGYTPEDFIAIDTSKVDKQTLDADIKESKDLYDVWDPVTTDASNLYSQKTFKYAPAIDTSNVINMSYMFQDCNNMISVPKLDTSKVINMNYMFAGSGAAMGIKNIPLLDTSNVTDMDSMFYNCSNLTTIPQLDTNNVIYMSNMFSECINLISIPQLDTSKVTDMDGMFYNCEKLTSIPELNTSKVTNMGSMFRECKNLTTIPQLDTSNVTNMGMMFANCTDLISLPKLNTKYIKKPKDFSSAMLGIFGGIYFTSWCINLTNVGGFTDLKQELDVSGCTALTKQSLINIMTEAANLKALGLESKTFTFGSTLLAKLSETEKKIATDKGWILA